MPEKYARSSALAASRGRGTTNRIKPIGKLAECSGGEINQQGRLIDNGEMPTAAARRVMPCNVMDCTRKRNPPPPGWFGETSGPAPRRLAAMAPFSRRLRRAVATATARRTSRPGRPCRILPPQDTASIESGNGMPDTAILQTSLGRWPVRRGKVRDIYDLGGELLLVSTDRISAFDWVLPTGIPDKGRVLTADSSAFWFDLLGEPNQMLSTDVEAAADLPADRPPPAGRPHACWVRKTQVVPIECVVRGYLAGSGWAEYRRTATVCGIPLPAGLTESAQLARADLHAGHQGRDRARREHQLRRDGRAGSAARWPKSCASGAWRFTPGGPSTRGSGAF